MKRCNEMRTLRQFPKKLRLFAEKEDPVIRMQIPPEMLLELTLCSIEDGHSIEPEIIAHLAHSLVEHKGCIKLKQIRIEENFKNYKVKKQAKKH